MLDYGAILSQRAQGLKPSGIRKFFDLLSEMQDVITLGVGEPDFATPWHIRNAGIYSLEKGSTWYTSNAGMPELRAGIAGYLNRRFGLSYDDKSEILVTVGGSEAIDLAVRALVEPGDEVVIPEPSFVCYSPLVTIAGGTPVTVQTLAENRFRLTPEQLRAAITPRTKLLVLPYPNNPTGAVLRREDLEGIAQVLRGTNVMVLSDEIYAELTYNGRHVSVASIDGMRERTILVSGFSKAFAMTGWRLGYVCAPPEITAVMHKVHQFAVMCAPTVSQYAAIEAINNGDEDIGRMAGEYDMRRRLVVDGLHRMGLPCFEPEGAFYVFPSIRATGLSSEEFAQRLLFEKKVAVVPGTAFGECGEGFLRLSYCNSISKLNEALGRIGCFLREQHLLPETGAAARA